MARYVVVAALFATVAMAGCAETHSAWEYYDTCTSDQSFHYVATCGKARRQAACEAAKTCTPLGDQVVAYADSLDQSVQRHEINDAEAQRKWIEFRLARANEQRQAAQAAAASGQTICNPVGNSMICN